MKAIILVKNASFYQKFNDLTFDVAEIGSSFIAIRGLNPDNANNLTDFTFNEVFIVDIDSELQKAREAADWYGGKCLTKYNNLKKYCEFRKIEDKSKFIPAQ